MIRIQTIEDMKPFWISTRLLMQEALRKGYEVYFFPGSPISQSGITRAVKKDRELYFKSTCPIMTSSLGYFAAEDKILTDSLLSARGINMPASVIISPDESFDKAKAMLREFDSLVVKPAAMNHGDGITVGVRSEEGLDKAVQYARKAAGAPMDVIVQQKVDGNEYRFLVVDGKVAAVASRRPPYVIGDGSSTIEELIKRKNQDPRRGNAHDSELTLIDIYEVRLHKGDNFLAHILEKDQKEEVLATSNLSRGGEAIDFTDQASKALKKIAVDAARACFLSVAGIDIMTNDITTEALDDSYIIEVNLGPGLRMHQFPSQGTPRDVAKVVFKALEKNARPIDKNVKTIGRAERIKLPDFMSEAIPARIDTGAVISSLWASSVKELDGGLEFVLFDKTSTLYTGKKLFVDTFSKRVVTSSMGHAEDRYVIKTTIRIKGKKISARFTLANRSTQVYPILIGRNILRNNFIVDVFQGKPDNESERTKRRQLNQQYKEDEK